MVPAISFFFFALLQYLLTALHTNSNYFKKSIDKTSISAYNNRVLATIAQLAEHLIRNERVVGSNPISGSRKHAGSRNREPVFLCKMYLECTS